MASGSIKETGNRLDNNDMGRPGGLCQYNCANSRHQDGAPGTGILDPSFSSVSKDILESKRDAIWDEVLDRYSVPEELFIVRDFARVSKLKSNSFIA
jgi:hypothetical protein